MRCAGGRRRSCGSDSVSPPILGFALLAGVGEHLGKKETLILNGVSHTASVIATVFEKDLAAADTADKLRAQLRTAVEEQNRVNAEADGLVGALKSYVALKYGEASTTFSDFGFLPKKVTVKSSGAKAQAAEKLARPARRATRWGGVIGVAGIR